MGKIAVQKSHQSFGCTLEKDLGTTVDSYKKIAELYRQKPHKWQMQKLIINSQGIQTTYN